MRGVAATRMFLVLGRRSFAVAGCTALVALQFGIATTSTSAKPRTTPETQPSIDHRSSRAEKLEVQLGHWSKRLRTARKRCDSYADHAKSGDMQGMLRLGYCYLTGSGRPKRLLKARAYFDRAAAQGSAEAHLQLGLINLDGSILKADSARAAHHFLAAARLGNVNAMTEYGLSLTGSGPSQRTACDWYERASWFESARALRLLGDCFASGEGRPLNATRARQLYRQAADQGDRTARLKMERHRFSGSGALMAQRQGCDWLLRAAARGNIKAMMAISSCLGKDGEREN